MIPSTKDNNHLSNLISNITFNRTTVGKYVLASDVIKLPVFEFNHSGQFQKQEVINNSEMFIDLYLDKINAHFFSIEDYTVKQFSYDPVQIKDKFLDLVTDLCERSGKYKSTYDIMYQLTHYVSSMNISIRVAMEELEDGYVVPIFVAALTMDAKNKFDKSHNKTLELDTFKLNN